MERHLLSAYLGRRLVIIVANTETWMILDICGNTVHPHYPRTYICIPCILFIQLRKSLSRTLIALQINQPPAAFPRTCRDESRARHPGPNIFSSIRANLDTLGSYTYIHEFNTSMSMSAVDHRWTKNGLLLLSNLATWRVFPPWILIPSSCAASVWLGNRPCLPVSLSIGSSHLTEENWPRTKKLHTYLDPDQRSLPIHLRPFHSGH